MARLSMSSGTTLALCIIMLAVGCGKKSPRHGAANDQQWEPYIEAYTSGMISRDAVIRIHLTADAIPQEQVGGAVQKGVLSFSPSIKGTAIWSDRRTLEMRPAERLANGKDYQGRFELYRTMPQVPKQCRIFSFAFRTIQQALEVRLEGLQPLSSDVLIWQQVHGALLTADGEEGPVIEQILHASQDGKALPVHWEHAADRLQHAFTVDSVRRGDDSSHVVLTWNGSPIGVDRAGEERVRVPALGEFTILDIRNQPGAQQYIAVVFSDPLDRAQDLNGLVQLSTDPRAHLQIEHNEIRIYPSIHLGGALNVVVNEGIRNIAGKRYPRTTVLPLTIENLKPSASFTGKGVIIPGSGNLSVPFEVINLRAVQVRAIRIFENNIPQFLQVNNLDGMYELRRVGHTVWRKTVPINMTNEMRDRPVRCAFDVTPLIEKEPNAIYRIELSFTRADAIYSCEGADTVAAASELSEEDESDGEGYEYAYNSYDDDDDYGYRYTGNWQELYKHRDDPCSDAYYYFNGSSRNRYGESQSRMQRNFIASNIGLTAKRGVDDTLLVAVTDLMTAQPMNGVEIKVLDFQNQVGGSGRSDANGFCRIPVHGKPFLCIADNGKQKGWLRVDDKSMLQESHFDVGGAAVQFGIKGMLYGERGVWRPGDSLFLTFALEDKLRRLPPEHPVVFELVNPRGQVVQTMTRTSSVGGFYNFSTLTAPDAPTGNYIARVKIGGATFEQTLKIEAVMPNRLKVQLDFGGDTIFCSKGAVRARLSTRWLTGAAARGLRADVEMNLASAPTAFPTFRDFTFEDPVRTFSNETRTMFDDAVSNEGIASVNFDINESNAPGMLRGAFRTRVFEPGGSFSVNRQVCAVSPYDRYIGLKLPRPNRPWGALFIDTTHTVKITAVDAHGHAASAKRVQVSLYKADWHWWWERGSESLADYISGTHHRLVKVDTLAVKGETPWSFRVNRPEWGRYLVRAVDLDGGHAAGSFFYLDWPDDYGRPPVEGGQGASVLAFTSDKNEYAVGEKAVLSVPSSEKARILVSVEDGTRVLRWFWADAKQNMTRISLDVTPDMAPTAYVYIAHVQPYGQTVNDLPIRMYGVIPIRVVDPATKLVPQLTTPPVMRPGEKATVGIREKSGREMVYTLAIVDEGLLDLTQFKTPDLWNYFYQREALGVRSWDLYNLVCGAYGAKLERLLAIGGDEGMGNPGQKRGNRFPPMVRFIGPVRLAARAVDHQTIEIPQYVGSVRVMVVAGYEGAYGKADTAVPVRKPLMVLGTLPRVLGPMETTRLPVSVFALEPAIKDVVTSVEVSGAIEVNGASSKSLHFSQIGDDLVSFEIKAKKTSGIAHVKIHASGNGQTADQSIDIEVRNTSRPVVNVLDTVLPAQQSWKREYQLPGVAGSNSATIEISRIPPINLGRRLDYLVSYPYGCVEQVTSSVFPQLYLDKIVEMSDDYRAQIQRNVQAGIEKLRSFQTTSGGFAYWPGRDEADPWSTSYAGQFLAEARLAGYSIPSGLAEQWQRYQKRTSLEWNGTDSYSQLIQAYRLFTLALAQKPEVGAMNRLRERPNLPVAVRWRLAAAYALVGQNDAARDMLHNAPTDIKPYRDDYTYGSDFRDRAMMLETMVLLNDQTSAALVAKAISQQLSGEYWLSTQETAQALLAMAKFLGKNGTSGKIDVTIGQENGKQQNIFSKTAVMQRPCDLAHDAVSGKIDVRNNSDGIAYVRLIMKGTPVVGTETSANQGIAMSVKYLLRSGKEMDPVSIAQGTDFIAEVTLDAQAGRGPINQVALSQIFPSGWEIRNTRFEEMGKDQESSGFDYQDIRDDRVYTFFSVPLNESRVYRISLNASYLGNYYLPVVYAGAMYDESVNSRVAGKWVSVVEAGK